MTAMDAYVAGAAAALTVDALVYPLDTLKTRYQSQDYLEVYSPRSGNRPLAIRGLYQGVGSALLATLPAAGLFFSTYEEAKMVFSKSLPLPKPVGHALASGVAEMASCLILAPAEVVKQNAQVIRGGAVAGENHHQSTSLQAFRRLVADAGAAGRLFAGYRALVGRNLPFTALQFPLFEKFRERLWAWRGRRRGRKRSQDGGGIAVVETGLVAGGGAAAAGALAAWVTTPSDVVKTRIMLTAGTEGGSEQGWWSVARQIHRQRGLRGFFRGALFRSAWTALGSSLYLATYEMAKLSLKRKGRLMRAGIEAESKGSGTGCDRAE